VNYDYLGKYLLSAAYRYDGPTKGSGHKWTGSLPSAGWRIDQKIRENAETVSELKLRVGWVGPVRRTNKPRLYAMGSKRHQ
jgi:hypothetical protein